MDPNFTTARSAGDQATVQMAHGGGGRLMRSLIEGCSCRPSPCGGVAASAPPHDSAVLRPGRPRLAFTTDTFVVSPLFFPGGDIGKLAVYGTVNDLAMAGARPLYLSAGFILEEGLPHGDAPPRRGTRCAEAARQAGVRIVTGDTKVVDRGKGDGVFINTAGHRAGAAGHRHLARPRRARRRDPGQRRPGPARHRHHVGPRGAGASKARWRATARCLAGLVEALLAAGRRPALPPRPDPRRAGRRAERDRRRTPAWACELEEAAIPVAEPVAAACELLGLDPLYVANEGRLVAFVPAAVAQRACDILRADPPGRRRRSSARSPPPIAGTVELRSRLGGGRIVDLLSGEQMPRIC